MATQAVFYGIQNNHVTNTGGLPGAHPFFISFKKSVGNFIVCNGGTTMELFYNLAFYPNWTGGFNNINFNAAPHSGNVRYLVYRKKLPVNSTDRFDKLCIPPNTLLLIGAELASGQTWPGKQWNLFCTFNGIQDV